MRKQIIILLSASVLVFSGCGAKTVEPPNEVIEDTSQETTDTPQEEIFGSEVEDNSTNDPEAEISLQEAENSPEEDQSATESDLSFVEEYDNEIVVSSKMILDRFISGYKIPLATQLWTIADFDENGAVMAITNVTDNATSTSQTAIVVLTPVMDNDEMTGATPHYVSVGDTIYGNDGYCDEFFSNIEEILSAI